MHRGLIHRSATDTAVDELAAMSVLAGSLQQFVDHHGQQKQKRGYHGQYHL
jgi:hypothetical protein